MGRLQMSVGNPMRDWAVVDQTPPSKLDADNADDAELDIDFFDILRKKPMARRGSPHDTNKDPHFFGRSITTRGLSSASDKFEEQRSRQRGALLETSIQRYHTNNGFPLIDSFPRVFLDHKTEPFSGAIGIKTQLSTDTSVSVSMKALRLTVASSIGLEDREHISNELADLAEAYREGWSSGSDDDDE
ncbi:Protein dml-1 [Colletotrichum trifolii]|uniref:Protein dml-1 n=1 Tax=Colletotrichum trifolii TaxID=5466 RepID=A0A4V3HQP7_COLTR|nr:Protein dml-1 [Colletotrichum trifolii]